MLCKLLIYKDKLRITLEWIHSQASRRRDWSQSRPINGRKLYRVQSSSRNQQQKETEPQGLTEQQEPATLRSIETKQEGTSSEPAEPYKMRDNQSSTRKDAQGLQGYRVAAARAASDASEKIQIPRKVARLDKPLGTCHTAKHCRTKARYSTKHESRIHARAQRGTARTREACEVRGTSRAR